MRARHILKATALLTTAALYATSIAASMYAYDLSTYPAKFVDGGKFNAKIVVGQNAATSDVLGSIDIAASLQAASVTTKSSGGLTVSGDAKQIGNADKLELRESVGKVMPTLGSADLQALQGDSITTAQGTTDYSQYLVFSSFVDTTGTTQSTNQLQDFGVNYIDNRDGKVGDYLLMAQTDLPVFEWQGIFKQGLKSKRDSAGNLVDMQDRTINILGTDYNIVKATIGTAGTDLSMTLMGGSVPDTLRQGETKTYTINGEDYEVTLVFVSDPNSGAPQVKLSVNGEITKAMGKGDTDVLSGGVQLGIRDILVNGREGVASFFLGANKIQFGPSATNSDAFQSGKVSIDNQQITQGLLSIRGDFTASDNSSFEITSIKYRLKMASINGGDVYIPPGHGLRENLRYPQGLISPTLDITYQGLTTPDKTTIGFTPTGVDQYSLQFTSKRGQVYNVPLVSNRNGVFKFGSDRDDLVFIEAQNETSPNVGQLDYFVLKNLNGDSATNVMRYSDLDTTNHVLTLVDTDKSTQYKLNVGPSNFGITIGQADLAIDYRTYRIYVENWNSTTGNHRLSVDMNADGVFNNATAFFGVPGMGTVSLTAITYTATPTNASPAETVTLNSTTGWPLIIGESRTINQSGAVATVLTNGSAALTATVTLSNPVLTWNLKTTNSAFDTNIGVNGMFNWRVSPLTVGSTPQVTLAMAESDFTGPLATSSGSKFRKYRFTTDVADSTKYVGMGDYGAIATETVPATSNTPNSLSFDYPKSQRLPQVYVTAGTITTAPSGTNTVNPVGVGISVLDKDAPALGSQNLIIVGGPCANSLAAAFLGNPANCADGFEAGKGVIQSQENGKIAILVAGYNAQDTLGASRVLAAYNKYTLKGQKTVVVTTDLTHLVIADGG